MHSNTTVTIKARKRIYLCMFSWLHLGLFQIICYPSHVISHYLQCRLGSFNRFDHEYPAQFVIYFLIKRLQHTFHCELHQITISLKLFLEITVFVYYQRLKTLDKLMDKIVWIMMRRYAPRLILNNLITPSTNRLNDSYLKGWVILM